MGKKSLALRLEALQNLMEHIFAERKERYELMFEERQTRYDIKIKDVYDRLDDRCNYIEKTHSLAVDSLKEATIKSEIAQREYNNKSNEFRQTLQDQAATFLPIIEYQQRHDALSQMVEQRFKANDEKIEILRQELIKLRERDSELRGKEDTKNKNDMTSEWSTGLWVVLITSGGAAFLSLLSILIELYHILK